MSTKTRSEIVVNTIKVYVFPSLVTLLGMLIWRDVTEMRSDVKMLLAQANIDKTKIENLQNDVNQLESKVFDKKLTSNVSFNLNSKLYFKPEEEYDIKKFIPKNI